VSPTWEPLEGAERSSQHPTNSHAQLRYWLRFGEYLLGLAAPTLPSENSHARPCPRLDHPLHQMQPAKAARRNRRDPPGGGVDRKKDPGLVFEVQLPALGGH